MLTVGQFKDDQFQSHVHNSTWHRASGVYMSASGGAYQFQDSNDATTNGATGRIGTTTRGKRKAVKFIIKVL